jgi:hypothetical protein
VSLNFLPWTTVVLTVGRKGLFSSAAAGVSLVAASLVLVIGVSALIGFRGFTSARDAPTPQSVVLRAPSGEREAAGTTTAPVVIGSRPKAAKGTGSRPTKRPSRRSSASGKKSRTEKKGAPARGGLSAPAAQPPAPAAEQPAAPEAPAAPVSAPEVPEDKAPPAAPPTPVDEVVEDVTGAVEDVQKPVEKSVGDVLLDVRDVLP